MFVTDSEPVFENKTLSAWLEQSFLGRSILFDEAEPKARNAVRQIGTNAIPFLIESARAETSTFQKILSRVSEKQSLVSVPFQDSSDVNHSHNLAVRGFSILGPAGASAVPDLRKLLKSDDFDLRTTAAFCLAQIGPAAAPAVPELSQMLSRNTNSIDVFYAAYALGRMGEAARPAVRALMDAAKRKSAIGEGTVAELAVIRITGQTLDPFLERLKDTSHSREWIGAAGALSILGTDAEPAIPMMLSALQQTNQNIVMVALRNLGIIRRQPDTCIPQIIPFLTSTNVIIRRNAMLVVRRFGSAARPARADVLEHLHDPDFRVRVEATNSLNQIDSQAGDNITVK